MTSTPENIRSLALSQRIDSMDADMLHDYSTSTQSSRKLARIERNIRRLLHSGIGRAHQTRRIWRWKRERAMLLTNLQPVTPRNP